MVGEEEKEAGESGLSGLRVGMQVEVGRVEGEEVD